MGTSLNTSGRVDAGALSYLDDLEAEASRSCARSSPQAERPVMLYSIGKDSSVMLHLARRPSIPGSRRSRCCTSTRRGSSATMYAFRDEVAAELGVELLVHVNQEGLEQGIGPFTHGSQVHTDVMKTEALKQALDQHGFDAAIGGARRDEEKLARQGARLLLPLGAAPLGPEEPAAGAVAPLQRAQAPRRVDPRLPALELDRARRLALHLPREDPDRAALLRAGAAGGRARRHADHGRRRSHAARAAARSRRCARCASARSAATRSPARSRASADTLPSIIRRDAAAPTSRSARAA